MDDLYVVGAAMTRFGPHPADSLDAMVGAVLSGVTADAGASIGDIESAYYGSLTQSMLIGQGSIGAQVALRPHGVVSIPVVNVENACATGSTAFHLAVRDLMAGASDVALAIGVEKIVATDKVRLAASFEAGLDVMHRDEAVERVMQLSSGYVHPDMDDGTVPRSIFMDLYASWARAHMRDFGTTPRQLAAVSSKNHGHSVQNPLAQFRKSFSIDEVLAARTVCWPLTLPMCAPSSEGAAAVLLCNRDALDRFDRDRAVAVRASVLGSGSDRDPSDHEQHATRRIARMAYEAAGIEPDDVSVAEVHDATAFGEIQQVENLGFCATGDGGAYSESGATSIGGSTPVNTSGGLESKGHPLAATGLGQIHELVTQLRGEAGPRQVEAARWAVAENGGGLYGIEEAAACVSIFHRDHATA